MSARQWAILSDVSRLGVTSGGQLQRLHHHPQRPPNVRPELIWPSWSGAGARATEAKHRR